MKPRPVIDFYTRFYNWAQEQIQYYDYEDGLEFTETR